MLLWVKNLVTDLSYPLPVTRHHGFVCHELQQGAALTEIINSFLQIQKGLPVLQGTGQLATSKSKNFHIVMKGF